MNQENIEKIVSKYIINALEGLEIENPKVDFKRKWYDLTNQDEVNEFLKDITAIANTYGYSDGYIIMGFDSREKIFYDSFSRDSNLKDNSQIPDIIIKRCSDLFSFGIYDILYNDKKLSVIHIPPTFEKPIFIKNYQKNKEKEGIPHRVFVRKETKVREASKHDIEMMFYERGNMQPDYDFDIQINDIFSRINSNIIALHIEFLTENYGKKSLYLEDMKVIVSTENFKEEFNYHSPKTMHLIQKNNPDPKFKTIFLHNNSPIDFIKELNGRKNLEIDLELTLKNGKNLSKHIEFIPKFSIDDENTIVVSVH
jgi:Putative DNA-binding domain